MQHSWHILRRSAPARSTLIGRKHDCATLRLAAKAPRTIVTVSQRRLQEFLEAEISYLAQGGYSTITVEQILEHRAPEHVAQLITKELPARFATRIRQIEATTPEWNDIPALAEVHEMLTTSFRNLRLVECGSSTLEPFTDVIVDLRQRHKPVVKLLASAASDLKERGILDDARIDAWLGKFMNSRIGTEMLTHHYMSLLNDHDEDHVGIVDTKCNPASVCNQAVDHVKRHFASPGLTLHLQVGQPDIEFSFISKYLFFIIEELLKNSVRVCEARCGPEPGTESRSERNNEIKITVCADPSRVGIQVSDMGGGIPFELSERIWEYMFSTSPSHLQSHFQEDTPLSGPGMGLPLCRLYARYLGGSLNLMSMPGVGTDVYVFFNRINAGGHGPESIANV